MADKPGRFKYFTPPRWSVFQTQERAVDDNLEKSRRKKKYFAPVETDPLPDALGSSLQGGLEVNSTFSIEDDKISGTHFTQITASGEETRFSVSPVITLSFIGERELENSFCLPGVENDTFSVDTDGKCNSVSVNSLSSDAHAMITKQTGKSILQESSMIGEHELQNTFCLPQDVNATFSITDNERKSNSKSMKRRVSKPHGMVTRQTGRWLQDSCTSGLSVLTEASGTDIPMHCFTPSASSSPTLKRTSAELSRVTSNIFQVEEPCNSVPASSTDSQSGRLDDTFTMTRCSISQHVVKESVCERDKEVLISSSKGARKKRYFQSPDHKAELGGHSRLSGETESTLMLATGGDSTFELPSHASRDLLNIEDAGLNVSNNSSEVQLSHVMSAVDVVEVRRSTRIKGKHHSSQLLAIGDATFEVPSHASDFKIQINAASNSTDLELSQARSRDVPGVQYNAAIKVGKNSPVLSPTKSPQNYFRRIHRVSRRIKANPSNSHLRSSDEPQMEGNRTELSVISENSATCSISDLQVSSKSPTQEKTANKKLNAAVPAVGVLTEQEKPSGVLASLPTYFCHAANMTVDKENLPENQEPPTSSSASHKIQAKSKIPVPVKQSACKEKFISKIPVIFKFKKTGLGSNKGTAVTKQQSADKVIPFQFTAKPVTFANKPAGQARAFESHRAEAAAQRRMTARSVALKTAPRDRDGKTLKHQKLYHEMVRVNRAHELMKRRNI